MEAKAAVIHGDWLMGPRWLNLGLIHRTVEKEMTASLSVSFPIKVECLRAWHSPSLHRYKNAGGFLKTVRL